MLLAPGPTGFVDDSRPSSGTRRNRMERASSEGVLRFESIVAIKES